MTLYEFLLETGVDIKNNKSMLGNHLDAELALRGISIDFDKDLQNVTENELLEIGRILILSEKKGVSFWSNEIIAWMKNLIEKYHT